jgi:putative oxygen-independent coproporphyrinogen III oxidase
VAGLYVHIPFCASKCGYCGFASEAGREVLIPAYLDALGCEAAALGGPSVDTVYVGGGTPTVFDVAHLTRLFDLIRACFVVRPDAEFTVEANPGTLTRAKADLMRRFGVNRVSVGVQSFEPEVLQDLGRAHTREEALDAVHVLRDAGFDNISVDLIFGFEGRSRDGLARDLDEIARLGVPHVSLYMLSIEPGSRFERARRRVPDPDAQAGDYLFVSKRLRKTGCECYEVSNFSRPGWACRHNLNYWNGGDYFGLGVAAHAHHAGLRSWNAATLDEYLERMKSSSTPRLGQEVLTPDLRLKETFLLKLRTAEGVDVVALEKRLSARLPRDVYEKIDVFVREGFLVREGCALKATFRGRLLLDELSGRLI